MSRRATRALATGPGRADRYGVQVTPEWLQTESGQRMYQGGICLVTLPIPTHSLVIYRIHPYSTTQQPLLTQHCPPSALGCLSFLPHPLVLDFLPSFLLHSSSSLLSILFHPPLSPLHSVLSCRLAGSLRFVVTCVAPRPFFFIPFLSIPLILLPDLPSSPRLLPPASLTNHASRSRARALSYPAR